MRKIIENFIFQSIYQLSKIIIPIITIPIISRALKPSGVGIYNYTNSISQYMMILAGLGVTLYGNREIAQSKDNLKVRSQVFIDIFVMKAIITTISLVLYLFLIRDSVYLSIFLGQSLLIISVMFDVSWFFMGMEEFKKVSLINLFFQIISVALIVYFIHDSSDLLKYIYIQSLTTFLAQVSSWFFLKKQVMICKPVIKNIKRHFFNSLSYFIPQVAILLYTNVNKTILGSFSTKNSVAYYSNAQTINNIIITLITTLDTVLLPKMSYLHKMKKKKQMLSIMKKSMQLQLFFSIPAYFGVISITPEFVPWFFGPDFLLLKKLIPIISCLIIIVPLGMAISRQYLLPLGEIKNYNISIIIGAIVNICINIILIRQLGVYSAIIATISAEFMVMVVRYIKFKKAEQFSLDIIEISKSLINSFFMFIIIRQMTNYFILEPRIATTIIQIVIGGLVYILLSIITKSSVIRTIIHRKVGN